MSWEERPYGRDQQGPGFGRPGGDWQGVRPRLDNPMSWSISIGRYFGVNVRVHILMLLWIVVELLRSWLTDQTSFTPFYTVIMLLSLFVCVLLHEFGHVFACRGVGGTADEILMWPLGGLAYCHPPDHWKAHLWTVIGGPLVNVVLAVVFGAVLLICGAPLWTGAIPVPLLFPDAWWQAIETREWMRFAYLFASMNMLLLLFNVLLPLFPMDGGRIVQALLWSKMGYVKSMRIAVRIGYIGAILLGVVGIAVREGLIIGIAIFGGLTCWMTHKQLEFTEEMMGFGYDEYALNLGRKRGDDDNKDDYDSAEPALSKREMAKQQRAEQDAIAEQAELDRLLEKIARGGMESLSSSEKRWLERQSRKMKSDKK